MAAESGKVRQQRFHALAAEHASKAEEHARKAREYQRMADACAKGNAGEDHVAGLLDTLDGAGWQVLNDRYKSRTSPANLDHVVVGPAGVAVVDAKNWASGAVRLDDRGMAVGGHRRDEELRAALDCVEAVRTHVVAVLPDAPVTGLLAFVGDMTLPAPVQHHGVVLLQAEQLLPWLVNQPTVLTPQQVHQLASSLDAALPPRTGPRAPFVLDPAVAVRRSPGRTSRAARGRTGPARPASSRSRAARGPRGRSLRSGVARLAVAMVLLLVVLPAVLQDVVDRLTTQMASGSTTPVSTPAAR